MDRKWMTGRMIGSEQLAPASSNVGRRGRRSDPSWVNRRHLQRARERLSDKRFATMWNACIDGDPSGELLATWIAGRGIRGTTDAARVRP